MSNYSLTGPTTGPLNQASPQFTVTPNSSFTGVITPASSLAGTFTPASLTFTASVAPQTFTFTPTVAGTANISTTNTGGFTDPAAIPYIVVAVPLSYITTAGAADIAAASPLGPFVNIGSFKIGSDNIFSDSPATLKALTSVQSGGTNSAVYTMANTSQIQYNVLSPNEVAYIITLDETVGNFTIGNVGLYTTDGTLFAIIALSATTSKVMSAGGILGNRRVYEIIVDFSNAAILTNLTILTQYTYNLATVATELVLPSPITPPYNVYLIQMHTKLGVPCLAINYNNAWTFFTSDTTDAQNPGAVAIPPGMMGSSVNPGDAIYYNVGSNKFSLASSGHPPIGVAGFGNYIYLNNSVFYNAAGIYTAGQPYYCVPTGGTGNVQLSTGGGSTSLSVGIALSSNVLLIQTEVNQFPSSLGINGYKKYPDPNSPSGYYIEQWMSVLTSASGAQNFNFPVAFPTAFLNAQATFSFSAGAAGLICPQVDGGASSTTGIPVCALQSPSGSFVGVSVYIVAKGY